MSLLLNGNSKHVAHEWKKKFYSEMIIKLAPALYLNKCLKHVKLPILLYTCAPFSELPSNISTMVVAILCVLLKKHQYKLIKILKNTYSDPDPKAKIMQIQTNPEQ